MVTLCLFVGNTNTPAYFHVGLGQFPGHFLIILHNVGVMEFTRSNIRTIMKGVVYIKVQHVFLWNEKKYMVSQYSKFKEQACYTTPLSLHE